jgi:hypothetical protein
MTERLRVVIAEDAALFRLGLTRKSRGHWAGGSGPRPVTVCQGRVGR